MYLTMSICFIANIKKNIGLFPHCKAEGTIMLQPVCSLKGTNLLTSLQMIYTHKLDQLSVACHYAVVAVSSRSGLDTRHT